MVERFRERNKREDRRSGEIVALLFNVNRDSEKSPQGINWMDVFPEWKEPEPEQTEEEMLKTMMMVFATKPIEGLNN